MGKCIITRRGGGEKVIVQTPTVQTYTASGETVPIPNFKNFVILRLPFSGYSYWITGAVARINGTAIRIYVDTNGISVAYTTISGSSIDMGSNSASGAQFRIIGWN